jgi:hypothetical protein
MVFISFYYLSNSNFAVIVPFTAKASNPDVILPNEINPFE